MVEVRASRYRHVPSALPITFLPRGCDFDALISSEMNRPFLLDIEGPFRAYVSSTLEGRMLVIVYDHWLADSVSIRLLMREWFFRLAGEDVRSTPVTTLQQPAENDGQVELPFSLESLEEWRERGRYVRRIPQQSSADMSVSHRLLRLTDCSADTLRSAARDRGVKVTDLLLCSIARVCNRHLPAETQRPDLALGNVRDLRPSQRQADPDAFGSMLAMSTLICPHEALADRDLLLAHIAQKNRQLRTAESFHGRNLDRRVGFGADLLLHPEKMIQFCYRRAPIGAGLSNVNLTNTWVAQHPEQILEYYRVSPTGPLLPIVVTPTTLNEQINVSLTWRRSVFTPDAIDAFATDLLSDLRSWTIDADAEMTFVPAA